MHVLILPLIVLMLTGCASTVMTDYDSAVPFEQYDTWAFAPEEIRTNAMSLDSSRLETAIKRVLEGRNLRRAPAEEADLWVTYGIEEVERLDTSGFSYGLGLHRGLFGFGVATRPPIREIQEGQVVLELIDPSMDRVVWRASSNKRLNEGMSPDRRRELINEVVVDMFEKYPPGT